MAAGTAVDPMTMTSAQPIAAQDFSHVVTAHRPQIFRFLLASTRDVDLAETLTQECFLKAHRNWAGFRGESSALTWLMRIAINVQKDHWRNRRLQFWRTTSTNAVDVDEAGEWLPSGARSGKWSNGLANGRERSSCFATSKSWISRRSPAPLVSATGQ